MKKTETSRREFIAMMAAGSAAMVGCALGDGPGPPSGGMAFIPVRPWSPSLTPTMGRTLFNPANPNDGSLFVPASYDPLHPMPLVVALHGAGGLPAETADRFEPEASARGFLLLVPGSRGVTWDVITFRFSYDVAFITDMLAWTFDRCLVDYKRVGLQGFSDGATYALGLGIPNGGLFTHVIANSGGYVPESDSPAIGKPKFFVSHGTSDTVLHIDNAARRFVPQLEKRGYTVDYTEFPGGHVLTDQIRDQSLDWFFS